MEGNRKTTLLALSLPALLVWLIAGPRPVDAASARGTASATVLTPSVISLTTVSIVVPVPNVVASSGSQSASVSTAAGEAGDRSGSNSVAGVQVSTLDGGHTLNFSIGDAASAVLLQLSPNSRNGNAPVAAAPLSGDGRLAIVLSQAPTDLAPNSISLTVNFN
jgi:hypothetical protein